MTASSAFWAGKRVLVTGHTGFKGAWLVALLHSFGADVSGFALAPDDRGAYLAAARGFPVRSTLGDIRDQGALRAVLDSEQPEVVFHLAAQALVRQSYADPVETFDVNVTGTAAVLHEATNTPSVRVILTVTSDKVYANDGSGVAFQETDRLGGGDPYSASKSAAEMVIASWQYRLRGGDGPVVLAARAGNVIGGGDRAADRLLPDLFRAVENGMPLEIRHPDAVRPWQFVLEPLAGYLLFAEQAWAGSGAVPAALNFGPGPDSCWPVRRVVDELISQLEAGSWAAVGSDGASPEATLLLLDSSLAEQSVGWRPVLDLPTALAWTAGWHHADMAGQSLADLMTSQIDRYQELTAR